MAPRRVDATTGHVPPAPADPAVASDVMAIQDEVRAHFGWSLEADRSSAEQLIAAAASLPASMRIDHDSTMRAISDRIAVHPGGLTVVGAAAEPAEVSDAVEDGCLLLVADGAFGALLALPTERSRAAIDATLALVTDGDGGEDVLAVALDERIPMVLHAHGDNREQWTALLGRIADCPGATPMPLALTHQTPTALSGAWNPGGFTDGDRAACIALALESDLDRILLLGHRTDVVGRWSGATDPARKMEKLVWMARVLDLIGLPLRVDASTTDRSPSTEVV